MSTDLYGIRVLDVNPKQNKIKLKVFVVYYDVADKTHKPIPKDPSFFLRVLYEQGGRIGKENSLYDILDEKWVNKNTFQFIKKVELLNTTNFPLEDYSSYHDFYYEQEGAWVNEDKLVQATYEIEVSDKKYLEHLSVGMSWGTTSYESNAFTQRHKDEIFLIIEPAFDRLSSIVKESEEILSPLFNQDCSIEEAQDLVISLFKKQRTRANFQSWIEGLTAHLESESFPDKAKFALDDIIYFLKEVFFEWYHEKVPENLDRNNFNLLITDLQIQYKPLKNPLKIENPSQDTEVKEIQRLASRFLDEMKESFMDFDGVIEGLAYKLDC